MQEAKTIAREWFEQLQLLLCDDFESYERSARFEEKSWRRSYVEEDGGGVMRVMRLGDTFEKVGVNVSTVSGVMSEQHRYHLPGGEQDGKYWATGISVVIHPMNPYVPAMHFNTRHIQTTHKSWLAGGMDMTPSHPMIEVTGRWHDKIRSKCTEYMSFEQYSKIKKDCDEYFYLSHRQEPRGIGGIFYDHDYCADMQEFQNKFKFTKAMGELFLKLSCRTINDTRNHEYTEEDRQIQARKRSRYAEFNLLHDRGTKFGLHTNGNIEAILMSMPPTAEW